MGVAKGENVDVQKRIRELMNERGWTDYRLAKEANLSHSTVTNMFNRNNAPSLPTLEAVCNGFGITLVQFFWQNRGECFNLWTTRAFFKMEYTHRETKKAAARVDGDDVIATCLLSEKIWQNSRIHHFDRGGVKNTGAEGKIALRACLYNGKWSWIRIPFQEMFEKALAARGFEPPWGKRKAPAFVSKAGA